MIRTIGLALAIFILFIFLIKIIIYFSGRRIRFLFYGTRISVKYNKCFKKVKFSARNPDKASATVNRIQNTNYQMLLNQLLELKQTLALNDWGYLLLLKIFAEKVVKKKKNNICFLVFHLLNKSGYKVILVNGRRRVYILIAVKETIYNEGFCDFDGIKYYNLKVIQTRKIPKKFYTIVDDNNCHKQFSLKMNRYPKLANNIFRRQINFKIDDKKYNLSASCNKNFIDLVRDYPNTEFSIYYNLPWSDYELLSQLKYIIQGKSSKDSVSMLLEVLFQAFDYKEDHKQFGKEKFFFPDEMIYYPYSDCEDRAVFFALLVNKLTGLDVVGIEYSGHMATGINFNHNIDGDYITHRGHKYFITDPTYINSRAGESMPNLFHETVTIHDFS